MNTKPILNLQRLSDGSAFDRGIQTDLKRIAYDVTNRTGYIDGGPNDMAGSIEIFKALDPEVCRIISSDMAYIYRAGEGWQAMQIKPEFRQSCRINLITL